MTKAIELADRTHEVCTKLRTTSVALADFIPHIQAMADELRRLAAVEQELADLKAALGEPVPHAHFTDEQISRAMDGRGWHLYSVPPGTPLYAIKAAK